MKKIAAGIALTIATVIAVVVFYLMFSGPRMRVQPKLVPYQAMMPATPEGIVPVAAQPAMVPPVQAVAQLRNPLSDTALTREAGQTYYGYYCAFCHGRTGHGDGPVGYSYTPVPTDLTLPRVQALSDGELYRAMLTGVGHEPVLGYVMRPQAAWYIVGYVRSLQSERAEVRNLTQVQQDLERVRDALAGTGERFAQLDPACDGRAGVDRAAGQGGIGCRVRFGVHTASGSYRLSLYREASQQQERPGCYDSLCSSFGAAVPARWPAALQWHGTSP